jgi:hypothetical protein
LFPRFLPNVHFFPAISFSLSPFLPYTHSPFLFSPLLLSLYLPIISHRLHHPRHLPVSSPSSADLKSFLSFLFYLFYPFLSLVSFKFSFINDAPDGPYNKVNTSLAQSHTAFLSTLGKHCYALHISRLPIYNIINWLCMGRIPTSIYFLLLCFNLSYNL